MRQYMLLGDCHLVVKSWTKSLTYATCWSQSSITVAWISSIGRSTIWCAAIIWSNCSFTAATLIEINAGSERLIQICYQATIWGVVATINSFHNWISISGLIVDVACCDSITIATWWNRSWNWFFWLRLRHLNKFTFTF